jgi:hypothetical protein
VSQLLPCSKENQQPLCQDKLSLAGGLADSRSMIQRTRNHASLFVFFQLSPFLIRNTLTFSWSIHSLWFFLVALATSPPIFHHPCHPPFLRRPSWGGLVFYFYKQCFPFLCIFFSSLGFAFRALLTLSQYFITTTAFFSRKGRNAKWKIKNKNPSNSSSLKTHIIFPSNHLTLFLPSLKKQTKNIVSVPELLLFFVFFELFFLEN